MKRRVFLFLLPIILLFGGLRLQVGSIINTWADLKFQASFKALPDLTLMKSFLSQFIPGKQANNYSINIVSPTNATTERYGLLELNLQTDIPYSNPYSNRDVDLQVLFTAPSGRRLAAGAFWYQDFDPQTRRAAGKPGWKVRFTPDEAGQWTAMAVDPELNVESKPYSFNVKPSQRTGFVRINPSDPRYLATEDGNFFFPIGVNMAWWTNGKDPIGEYRRWLEQFVSNGGNTIRVWMAAWSFGIEWKDSGLGNYDQRQYEAWLLDQLFRLADQYQVRIILVLINHGPFSLTVNSEWRDNPYNRSLGGPLDSPEQFVTDAQSITYFKQRMSYIINRWGYSPDLLAWEWFNEVDLTPITDQALIPWLKEMTVFLHQHDIYHHLTTNSFSVRSWSATWHLPELDIVQIHAYAEKLAPGKRDPADTVGTQLQSITQDVPRKPVLLGEFGYSSRERGERVETTGIQLHNGIWATTFSGYAGSGMYWWWDTYIAANNLWYQFKGLADFIKGEDLTQYQPDASLKIVDQSGEAAPVSGMALRGKTTLVWLRSDEYSVDASVTAKKTSNGGAEYSPKLEQGLTLELSNMAAGSYTIDWFDPQKAKWLSQETVSSKKSTLKILVLDFRCDLAVKISRIIK